MVYLQELAGKYSYISNPAVMPLGYADVSATTRNIKAVEVY